MTKTEYIDEFVNPTFYHPSVVHKDRDRFFKLIKKRKIIIILR